MQTVRSCILKYTSYDGTHEVHTYQLKATLDQRLIVRVGLFQTSSYCMATSKSGRFVDQMMNASNLLFTVNTKRQSSCILQTKPN